MSKSKLVALTVIIIGITGCAGGFKEINHNTVFGSPPENYKQSIQEYFKSEFDLQTVKLRIGSPVKGYKNKGALFGGGIAWHGYIVDAQIASQPNVGMNIPLPFIVLFDGEKIREHYVVTDWGENIVLIRRLCDGSYTTFNARMHWCSTLE